MRRFLTVFAPLALGAQLALAPVQAQTRDETLADIRQELSVLYVEIQRLKRELSTTGGARVNLTASATLERLDQIEAELARVTAVTEELTNRIDRIVRDGTNRIGDLEFRLVELEGGDVGKLGETTTLGGDIGALPPAATPPEPNDSPQFAIGEKGDFDRAVAALDAGDNQKASDLFAAFIDTYPDGPLTPEAQYYRGEALAGLGDIANAARAFLKSFSGAPDGPRAPEALYRLGVTLGQLGQINEACVSLGQLAVRFPDADVVGRAPGAMQDLNCP